MRGFVQQEGTADASRRRPKRYAIWSKLKEGESQPRFFSASWCCQMAVFLALFFIRLVRATAHGFPTPAKRFSLLQQVNFQHCAGWRKKGFRFPVSQFQRQLSCTSS